MNAATAILDFLLPRECHICGRTLDGDERCICASCHASLPRTAYHRMPDNPMVRRFMGIIPYRRCTSVFFYTPDSDLSNLIQDMKYRHFRHLGRRMGEIMAGDLLSTGFFNDIDLLVPVPMHFLKRARRGYNQVEELCRGISTITGIPVDTSLKAVRRHVTQTKLSHEQRLRNTVGIFVLKHPEKLAGKHVLLVDDVCTTGGTLISAANAILAPFKQSSVPPAISILTLSSTTS